MREIFSAFACTLACVVATTEIAFSQSAVTKSEQQTTSAQTEPENPNLAAIRAQSQAFVTAFNQHDAKAVAAFWTENGEYIGDSGRRYTGQAEIEEGYAAIFAANPDAQLRLAINELRLVGPETAIEDGSAVLDPAPAENPGISTYTAVHVKINGQWKMASVRDTWIETPAAERSAADLDWLVGTWIAEEHGVQTESICRWVVDNHFLERSYTITKVDGTQSTGVQLIGWNPLEGHVQSWDFSPDGGHAIGRWRPTESGWQADVHGTTGGGIPTSAVNVLRRLDDNAHVWQSVQRTLGEVLLPDTNEVVIKRRPAK